KQEGPRMRRGCPFALPFCETYDMVALCLALASIGMTPADTAVVCPPALRASLDPWVEHRTAQGHAITWIDSSGTADDIRQRIRTEADRGYLKTVVLVGDVPNGNPKSKRTSVPTHYQQ